MCRCKCYTSFTENEKLEIFHSFNRLKNHETQNLYLRGCVNIIRTDVVRRRPRNEGAVERKSFSYSVTVGGKTTKVCQAAFLGLHGIKRSRLQKKVLNFSDEIGDKRGKHDNHVQVEATVKENIRKHIKNFPARESHYSRSKGVHRKYLDASLNVAKMHRLYLSEDSNPRCTYSLYHDIFNHEYNITFGYPRSDICCTCEKQQVLIRAAELERNEAEVKKLKTEHELHLRKCEVFHVQLREVTETAKQRSDTAVISMDFQKNLPLPVTNVSVEYYKRQLWVHNFCMHDNVNESATMFLYAENFAAKGPNEVLSCLEFYISMLDPGINKLHIFADNCFSQNKNKFLLAYFYAKCHQKLQEIYIHYPLPGHSHMPCDRDFGRIEKNKRKKDKVVKPSEWIKLIEQTDLSNPFRVVFVQHPLTDNMERDGTPVVDVKDYKRALGPLLKAPKGIATVRGLLFRRGHIPTCRYTMTGESVIEMPVLKRGKNLSSLIAALRPALLHSAYITYLPISKEKANDVKEL